MKKTIRQLAGVFTVMMGLIISTWIIYIGIVPTSNPQNYSLTAAQAILPIVMIYVGWKWIQKS
jgi:hypothetical protein